jgi:hypothetical protein
MAAAWKLGLVVACGAAVLFWLGSKPPREHPAPAPDLLTPQLPRDSQYSAITEPPLEPFPELTPQALAAECLPALSARYPRGRLLKVQINQQMQVCNALLETAVGSNRYFGVQRRYRQLGFQVLGEVRLPPSYLQSGPLPAQTLNWTALLQRDLSALPDELIDRSVHPQAKVWAMQVVWMPAPYERAVWMVGFDNEAGEFEWFLDVENEAQATEVVRAMPGLAADLADPAASPDTVADIEADKLALFALEGGPAVSGTVYEAAAWCADALNEYNTGARVLRVVLLPGACTMVVEPSDGSKNWLVWHYRGYRNYSEIAMVVLPDAYTDLPNMTLDSAWLNAQSLQERMARAGLATPPRFIGLAWDVQSRDLMWVAQPQQVESSSADRLRFDRNGAVSKAMFPRLASDSFGDSAAPLLAPALEAAL